LRLCSRAPMTRKFSRGIGFTLQPIIIPFVLLKNRKKQVYTFWVERGDR